MPNSDQSPSMGHLPPESIQDLRVENAQNYFLDMYRAMKHRGVGGPEMVKEFVGNMQGRDPGAYGETSHSLRPRPGEIIFLEAAIVDAKLKGSSMLPDFIGPRPLRSYSPKDQTGIRTRWAQAFSSEQARTPQLEMMTS